LHLLPMITDLLRKCGALIFQCCPTLHFCDTTMRTQSPCQDMQFVGFAIKPTPLVSECGNIQVRRYKEKGRIFLVPLAHDDQVILLLARLPCHIYKTLSLHIFHKGSKLLMGMPSELPIVLCLFIQGFKTFLKVMEKPDIR